MAHLALAVLQPGDGVLVPNPTYPIHSYSVVIADGDLRSVPLVPGEDFFARLAGDGAAVVAQGEAADPVLPAQPDHAVRGPRLLREGGGVRARAPPDGGARLRLRGLRLRRLPGRPRSCEVPGAKDVGVEFFSTVEVLQHAGLAGGLRAAATAQMVHALARIKSYLDYGAFQPIQIAGIIALEGDQECVRGDHRALPQAPRRARGRAQQDRLAGGEAPGDHVRVGADPRGVPGHGLARVLQDAHPGVQGRGVAGHRLRRVRRRPRPLRPRRERAAHPAGAARPQDPAPPRERPGAAIPA